LTFQIKSAQSASLGNMQHILQAHHFISTETVKLISSNFSDLFADLKTTYSRQMNTCDLCFAVLFCLEP